MECKRVEKKETDDEYVNNAKMEFCNIIQGLPLYKRDSVITEYLNEHRAKPVTEMQNTKYAELRETRRIESKLNINKEYRGGVYTKPRYSLFIEVKGISQSIGNAFSTF